MASLERLVRRWILPAALAGVLAVLLGSPASAHSELVSSTPANGARLSEPPDEIELTFTGSVDLVEDGIRLVDDVGATIRTPEPATDGPTVTWSMPADLPDGQYVVTWRVVSTDGHPIAGAFSFGVGTRAGTLAGSSAAPAIPEPPTVDVPWPVVTIRMVGYLAFAVFAGVVAFVLWCSPGSSANPALQRLTRGALVAGALATVGGLLVQGPYATGLGMSRLLDPDLVRETLATPYGVAMTSRLVLYAVLAVMAWELPRVVDLPFRWVVPLGVVGAAVALAAAGHGASARAFDLGVDALHALTAGLWVGGLVALAVLGRAVEPRAVQRFSTLAMISVLTLVVTGTLNSLREVEAVAQLWQTGYGRVLLVKIGLVAATLLAARLSRRRLQQQRLPLGSVRLEAVMTVGVLAVTAVLSMTAPPPQQTPGELAAGSTGLPAVAANAQVQMTLGEQGQASLAVIPADTNGSQLHVILIGPDALPLKASRVTLKVSNPARDVAAIPVRLSRRHGVWAADYRFPLPGVWKTQLTVEAPGESAVVTAGQVTIED